MFVHYYTLVPRPFDEAARAVARDPDALFAPAGGIAGAGVLVTMPVGEIPGITPCKEARVWTGVSRVDEQRASVPIRIVPTGPRALFPQLEAELELAPVGAGTTQMTLHGSYRPPLGWVGEAFDRALLHRLAEAALKSLVDQVAVRLQELAGLGTIDDAAPPPASSNGETPRGAGGRPGHGGATTG